MQRRAALLAVVASSACFATLAVLARLAYAEGGRPLPLLTWRFAIASSLMTAYLLVRQPSALTAGLKDIGRFAALSLTGYGGASICFFFALRYASASVVTVLLYAYPALVTFARSLLDRRRVRLPQLAALLLAFVGCALAAGVMGGATVVTLPGVLLAIGAAVGYALFTLLSERLVGQRPRLVLMAYTFGLSALGVGALTLLTGESLSPAGWSLTLWGLLALIVLLPTFAAVLLFLGGIRHLGAPQAALVSALEPVFTILLAVALLAERLSVVQVLGAALVVGAVVLSEYAGRPSPVVV